MIRDHTAFKGRAFSQGRVQYQDGLLHQRRTCMFPREFETSTWFFSFFEFILECFSITLFTLCLD